MVVPGDRPARRSTKLLSPSSERCWQRVYDDNAFQADCRLTAMSILVRINCRNSGVIRVGDEVKFWQRLRQKFMSKPMIPPTSRNNRTQTEADGVGQAFRGNNQQVLLELIRKIRELYPLFLPFVEAAVFSFLVAEVRPLKNRSAMGDDGTILCCSCVPYRRLHLSWRALDCLFEAEAVNINLRFQPVVHDFNGVAQLHRATRNNNAGLCQQA